MSDEPTGHTDLEDDPLLSVEEAAARAGIDPGSWRSGVSRKYLPPADDPDLGFPKERRRPRWRRSTVDNARDQPLGRGRRTDLVKKRKDHNERLAAEMAEPRASDALQVRAWLQANHRALLGVAETLVDHREELLAAVAGEAETVELARAIDQAGEAISSRPSRILAAAVTYAQFLLRPEAGVRAPHEVREVLNRYAHLHAEFNRVRPPGGEREA